MKTLTNLLDEFLVHMEAMQRSPVHRRIQRFSILRTLRWLEETHGVVEASQLTFAHLDAWFRHVATRQTRKGVPMKTTSVAKQLQADRSFVLWLEKTGAVPADLHEALPKVRVPDLLPTSVLEHAKMARLLERIDRSTPHGHELSTILELLYSTGMRIAELLGLDVGSIDLSSSLVRVRGKGNKERVVPIGATARNLVESYLRCIRPLFQAKPGETALFLNRSGERLPYHTFRRNLEAELQSAHFKVPVTAHTFRRSCATELIRGGANLWHVKDLLGHENVETLKHYVRLTVVDLKKAHKKFHPRERDRDA